MVTNTALDHLRETQIGAITVLREAGGEPLAGQIAVMQCIVARVRDRRWANTVRGVVLAPWQFSCWNVNDPNRAKGIALAAQIVQTGSEPKAVERLRQLFERALDDKLPVLAGLAPHYHRIDILPSWAQGRTPAAVIGDHVFYTDVP